MADFRRVAAGREDRPGRRVRQQGRRLPQHLPRAVPGKTTRPGAGDKTSTADGGSYSDLFRDRRYLLYLVATFFNAVVYVQYMSTLPLDVTASGVPIFWYTLAVAINGGAVILLELVVTKKTQNMRPRLVVFTAYALTAAGVALYGLPLGPAVIVIGTLVWTLGEIIGGPVVFAYPGMAGPAHLKGRYIGSFQFMFGLGAAVGPVLGGFVYLQVGHAVWSIMAVSGLLAAVAGYFATRNRGQDAVAAV